MSRRPNRDEPEMLTEDDLKKLREATGLEATMEVAPAVKKLRIPSSLLPKN
jgi:hypothetical protein